MIYFVRAGDDGPVKIGRTRDSFSLRKRLSSLQTGQPHRLVVLRTIDGDASTETWLHGFFSGVRMAGEWFAFKDEMLTIEPTIEPNASSSPIEGVTITPAQCRAGRAWLQWSQSDLAAEAKVSVPTINRFERGATSMPSLGQAVIVRAFEDAGVTVSRDEEMGYGGLTGRL